MTEIILQACNGRLRSQPIVVEKISTHYHLAEFEPMTFRNLNLDKPNRKEHIFEFKGRIDEWGRKIFELTTDK